MIALVGINNVTFTTPLFPNDTIWVETEVMTMRPTSKPKRHLVTVKDILRKPVDQIVLQMERLNSSFRKLSRRLGLIPATAAM